MTAEQASQRTMRYFNQRPFGAEQGSRLAGQSWITGWMDIGLIHKHTGGIQDGRYVPADVFDGYGLKLDAVALVLEQYF